MDGLTDWWMDRWKYGFIDVSMDGWMDGRMDGWIGSWVDELIGGQADGQMNRWAEGQIGRHTDRGHMGGWADTKNNLKGCFGLSGSAGY